jgi:chitodextrinase
MAFGNKNTKPKSDAVASPKRPRPASELSYNSSSLLRTRIVKNLERRWVLSIGLAVILSLGFLVVIYGHFYPQIIPSKTTTTSTTSGITPMPLISRGVPAYGNSGSSDPSYANDADYTHTWNSGGFPGWLAYDLSGVPSSERTEVYAYWTEIGNYDYDSGINNEQGYGLPGDYTIDVNPAPGGGQPPTSGWVTESTVTNNTVNNRVDVVNMSGDNWIRIYITSGYSNNDLTYHNNAQIKWDIYNASTGAQDSWMFYGDSITAFDMPNKPVGGEDTFANQINAWDPTYTPLQEGGGQGGWTSATAVESILGSGDGGNTPWLSIFPGRFVVLAFGTNDGNTGAGNTWSGVNDPNAVAFQDNMQTLITAVLNAGKVPIIPTIPDSPALRAGTNTVNIDNGNGGYTSESVTGSGNGPIINQVIRNLVASNPGAMLGPDLWNAGVSYWNDDLHPDTESYSNLGVGVMRTAWVQWAEANVYDGTPSTTTPPSVPTGLTSPSQTTSSISLSWTASSAGTNPVSGYNVYRSGTKVGTTSNTSYTDSGLSANTSYSYTVSAYDSSGNTSAQSSASSFSTLANTPTPPSVPTGLTSPSQTSSSISLSWTASSAGTNPVSGYNIYRNGTKVGTSSTTSYTDGSLSASTSYSYTVSAYDASGNTSAQSSSSSFSTLASSPTAPSVPTGLNSPSQTDSTINLAWTASTGGSGSTSYNIYRNGTKVGTSSTTSYTDTGLSANTSYSYTISAYGNNNATSAQSSTSSFKTFITADINGDGVVNVFDLSILLSHWGETGASYAQGDLNGDGVVNVFDLSILLSHWGDTAG